MPCLLNCVVLRVLALAVTLGLIVMSPIVGATERFTRDIQCQAEAIQYYYAVVDLQDGVAKEASVGPTFASLSIIRGPAVAAELEARYGEVKDNVWELLHFKAMDRTKTGILIYEECLALDAAASPVPTSDTTHFFNGEMLGANQRYLESVIGIPQSSYGNQHEFQVQGCDITATINDGKVSALHMKLSNSCRPDLRTFIGDYAPPPSLPLTVGSMEAAGLGSLRYSADCLTSCGNAYDPSVYAHWSGPRAAGFLEVMLEVTLVESDAIAAAGAWRDHMIQAVNEDYVLETRFNCDNRFNVVANEMFKRIKVTGITIGHGLKAPGC